MKRRAGPCRNPSESERLGGGDVVPRGTSRLRRARWLHRCVTSAEPDLHYSGSRVSDAHMRRREQG